MKKIRLNQVNLETVIGESNWNKINNKMIVRSFKATINIDQYILLSKTSNSDGFGLHSGILSFGQWATDRIEIGMFTIANPGTINRKLTTTNNNFKFYKVNKSGVEYISIRKIEPRYDEHVVLLSMNRINDVFEIVNVTGLTEITAL